MSLGVKRTCADRSAMSPFVWAAAIAAAVTKQARSAFMEKNYVDITKRISGDLRKLRQDIPDTMKAFSALAQAAGRDGALDRKTKELIALAIGIAARCNRDRKRDQFFGLPVQGTVRRWRKPS